MKDSGIKPGSNDARPNCGNDFWIIRSADEVNYSQVASRNRHASTNADSLARHHDYIMCYNPRVTFLSVAVPGCNR